MNEPVSAIHSLIDGSKKKAWRVITPVFPYVRDGLLNLGLIHHKGRQRYHLGWIPHGKSMREIIEYLAQKGFANHFVAWVDDDESVSLRKLVDFHFQYHLRIFGDGEIRGHYERTPEAHPIAHFMEQGLEARHEEFMAFFGEWVADSKEGSVQRGGKTASHRAPAASRGVPVKG